MAGTLIDDEGDDKQNGDVAETNDKQEVDRNHSSVSMATEVDGDGLSVSRKGRDNKNAPMIKVAQTPNIYASGIGMPKIVPSILANPPMGGINNTVPTKTNATERSRTLRRIS